MAGLAGIWSKLSAGIFGAGIGIATADAMAPALEPAKQKALQNNQLRVLDPRTAAELVAQGLTDFGTAADETSRSGFNSNRLHALIELSQVAPPVSEALELWRRGKISEAMVDRALSKEKVIPEYWDAIKELFNERLDPSIIANAIVRGIMKDPGFLPVGPPSAEGKVKAFPVSPLDPLVEAQGSGIDRDRLFVETAIAGRPMSPQEAAHGVFRAILEHPDYQRAIAEGDIRNEWAEAIFEVARQIPSASNFVNYRLRGWTDDAGMYAGTARHGMSAEDTDVLFKESGRPPSWHQIWIGLARGGTYDGPQNIIDPAFLKGLQESDIRPEWYNLLWHSRYNYPAPFVLRKLATDGDLTEAETEQILLYEGWEPGLAKLVAGKWSEASPAKLDPWVVKAYGQLWTALHKAYVGSSSYDDAKATTYLEAIGVTSEAANQVLYTWQLERQV